MNLQVKIAGHVASDAYGQHGIIREADMASKFSEFQQWAVEVKKANVEALPKWEEKELFAEFMEDFNTGTLPHKKYYDLDEYARQKALKAAKKGKSAVVSGTLPNAPVHCIRCIAIELYAVYFYFLCSSQGCLLCVVSMQIGCMACPHFDSCAFLS